MHSKHNNKVSARGPPIEVALVPVCRPWRQTPVFGLHMLRYSALILHICNAFTSCWRCTDPSLIGSPPIIQSHLKHAVSLVLESSKTVSLTRILLCFVGHTDLKTGSSLLEGFACISAGRIPADFEPKGNRYSLVFVDSHPLYIATDVKTCCTVATAGPLSQHLLEGQLHRLPSPSTRVSPLWLRLFKIRLSIACLGSDAFRRRDGVRYKGHHACRVQRTTELNFSNAHNSTITHKLTRGTVEAAVQHRCRGRRCIGCDRSRQRSRCSARFRPKRRHLGWS